jgi:hypothetical protein
MSHYAEIRLATSGAFLLLAVLRYRASRRRR